MTNFFSILSLLGLSAIFSVTSSELHIVEKYEILELCELYRKLGTQEFYLKVSKGSQIKADITYNNYFDHKIICFEEYNITRRNDTIPHYFENDICLGCFTWDRCEPVPFSQFYSIIPYINKDIWSHNCPNKLHYQKIEDGCRCNP